MTKVFFELGFVTINNGLISVIIMQKRSLTDAPTYKLRTTANYKLNKNFYINLFRFKTMV